MSLRSPHISQHIFTKIVAIFIITYLLIWAISSPIIKYFLKAPLIEQGFILSNESSISFNPFLTKVTIKDFSLTKEGEKTFSLKKLTLQLALHKLIFDKIELQELSIDELFVKITQIEDKLTVAGIAFPQKSTVEPTEKLIDNKAELQPSPYLLILPELKLTQGVIDFFIQGQSHLVDINELLINDVIASQQSQIAQISLKAILDKASLTLGADVNLTQGNGKINSKISLNEYPLNALHHFIEPLNHLSGLLSFNSTQVISISPNGISISTSDTELINKDLVVGIEPYILTLKELNNQVDDFTLELNGEAIKTFAVKAQINLSQANLRGANNQQQLFAFDHLSITDVSTQLNDKSSIDLLSTLSPILKIGAISLDNLMASKNNAIDLPPLVTINQINITQVIAATNNLSIDKINVDTLTSHIIMSKEKTLANLVDLKTANELPQEMPQNTESSVTPLIDEGASTVFNISLKELNFINNNRIDFVDNSVDPIYKRSLFIDEFSLGELSTLEDKKDQETPITLRGRSNEYANFQFNGFIKPFAKTKIYHIKGHLKELSLPDVSTYMKDALAMELKSGQLHTNLDVTLTNDIIDGDVNLVINGLETTAANNHETNTVKDRAGIPINTALGMLKDSDGNITLDVPLSGATSDPKFGISSFIALITKRAVMSATETYLIKTFVPYANIVSVARSAGEFLLKIRFEDLPYQPKQIQPNDLQQEYLDQFIALMKDKTDTQVKLCAISTPSDISQNGGVDITNKDNIKILKELAEKREHAFKAYVIKHGQIDSARLLLCAPQIDSSINGVPRMKLSI